MLEEEVFKDLPSLSVCVLDQVWCSQITFDFFLSSIRYNYFSYNTNNNPSLVRQTSTMIMPPSYRCSKKNIIHWLPPGFSLLTFPDSDHTWRDLTALWFTSLDSIVLPLLPIYSQPGTESLKQHPYSCAFHIYPFPLKSYLPHFFFIFLLYGIKDFI